MLVKFALCLVVFVFRLSMRNYALLLNIIYLFEIAGKRYMMAFHQMLDDRVQLLAWFDQV